jgi:hypothetical protein
LLSGVILFGWEYTACHLIGLIADAIPLPESPNPTQAFPYSCR